MDMGECMNGLLGVVSIEKISGADDWGHEWLGSGG